MIKKAEKNKVEELFLHSKPVKMLTALNKGTIRYATQVSKAVDCTYSHTVKVLEQFKNMGLVQFDKKGRIKLIKLTEQGQEVAHDFEGIRRKFTRIGSNIKEIPTTKKTTKKSKKK